MPCVGNVPADTGTTRLAASSHHVAQQYKSESGMKLSCIESTAPSEDAVLTVANNEDCAVPKRTSLPSMLPPPLLGTRGLIDGYRCNLGIAASLAAIDDRNAPRNSRAMTANKTQPWR